MKSTRLLLLSALASGAFADENEHAQSEQLIAEAEALAPAFVAPAPSATTATARITLGEWGSIINWTPHIPVTAATLPDGRLLTFSSNQRTTFPVGAEFTYAAVWNPKTGAFTEINNNRHDMFCGGTAMLPDGRVLINGGRNTVRLSSIFDWRTNQWSAIPNMNDPRWYNTSVALTDGSVFTVTGDGGTNTAERWTSSGGWQRLTGIPWQTVISQPGYVTRWHPLIMIAPDGRLFHGGPTREMNWITTANGGSLSYAGVNVPGALYPKEGCFAMYDEGQILVAGGSSSTSSGSVDSTTGTSTGAAFTIDLRSGSPVVSSAPSMQYARQFCNSVILPNGEVIVIGGNTSGRKFNDTGSILTPEIWNPGTRQWRAVAPMNVPRNYHSLALLLPDGRVWSGGGGLSGNSADHRDAQIFTPPQLYTPSGALVARPQITQAPAYIGTGTVFNVAASTGVTRFTFIKMSSQTHSVNTDLRFIELPFNETAPGQYRLTAHGNLNVMTPGYWMLFALNGTGAWSEAQVIQVDPSLAVSISKPADYFSAVNAPASLALQANAPGNGTLAFTAAGLPPGLALNSATGLINGTPTSAGTYNVQLAVTDGITLATTSFTWTITPASTSHDFTSFANADTQFHLNGSAYLNSGVLLLTPNTGNQAGSAFLKSPLPISATTSFTTRFVFRMNGTGDGADGMTFVLQNQAATALGALGGGLGYQGITPSLAVEIDTHAGTGDPNGNHLGILTNGNVTTHLATHNAAFDLENGGAHTLWIEYDGPAKTLRVFLAQGNVATRPATAVMTRTSIDLPTLLGPAAWIGFTGATGGSINTHEVLAWSFWANAFALPAAPVLAQPAAQTSVIGQSVSLALQASDANQDPLTFSVTGLPAGLQINPNTGLISGTTTSSGVYQVTASVTDGHSAPISTNFTWTVNAALSLAPLSGTPVQSGANSLFTASSQGGANTRYRWNFGDGTPTTALSTSPSLTHQFAAPGHYTITLTVIDDSGAELTETFTQIVHAPLTERKPASSTGIVYEQRATGNDRLWVVNPDNDSVTVFDAATHTRLVEIAVGKEPRCLAFAPNGRLWVCCASDSRIDLIDPDDMTVSGSVRLPLNSRPFGLVIDPAGSAAYVALEALSLVFKLDPITGSFISLAGHSTLADFHLRHLAISADGASLLASRFITPPVPGESTFAPDASGRGGEVLVIDPVEMEVERVILLAASDKPDTPTSARGLPNYLGAAAISPDGLSAWVPSKQDNIFRGVLRDGKQLTHDQTLRAIASRIDFTTQTEDHPARIDFDDAGMPSAAVFHPTGAFLFVALESTRAVAVVNPYTFEEIARVEVGRAPQGLAISPEGTRLYVHNFMDRSVSILDISKLASGTSVVPEPVTTLPCVDTEMLPPQILLGKQLFYDAADPRLAFQRYISCASCHNDGGQDGRVWDLSGFGEGLRNTITLRGHGDHGPLHWSGNFDEVQDFEGQIRNLAGGTGLMSDADFHHGTRSQPLGDPKAGLSPELDALAAYVKSLSSHPSPHRLDTGELSLEGQAGARVFQRLQCASCHTGENFTRSASGVFASIGTQTTASGQRLGGPLPGFDIPTLRGVWATTPYLHDGSARTLADAVRAHRSITINDSDLAHLVAYLKEIDDKEAAAPEAAAFALSGQNIGGNTLPGLHDVHSGTGAATVRGSGNGIGGNADGFYGLLDRLTGDGEIRARLTTMTDTGAQTRAALVLREDLSGGSRQVSLFATSESGGSRFGLSWRSAVHALAQESPGPALNAFPHNWLRLTRNGDLVTAQISNDGESWDTLQTVQLQGLPPTVFVGIAITSGAPSLLARATFDPVLIRGTREHLPAGFAAPYEPPPAYHPDLDGNGIHDLLDYLTGGTNQHNLWNLAEEAGQIRASIYSVEKDVDIRLQASADLKNWSLLPAQLTSNSGGVGPYPFSFNGVEKVPGQNPSGGFVRLRVKQFGGAETVTDPRTWQKHKFEAGIHAFGPSWLNPAWFQGRILGLDAGNVLVVDAAAWPSGTAPSLYLEILDGEHAGHRFDIRSSQSGRIEIELDAPHSTLRHLPASLVGARIVARPHQTLQGLFQFIPPQNTPATADQVLLHTTQGWQSFWRFAASPYGSRWVRAGDASLQSVGADAIIAPGSGVLLRVMSHTRTSLHAGHVRTTPFRRPLRAGYNFLALPWPLDGTPNGWLFTPANGFTAATSPALADQIQLWNGSGYDGYWLLRDTTSHRWTRQGSASLQDVGSTLPLPAASAFFLKARPETAANGWNLAPPTP